MRVAWFRGAVPASADAHDHASTVLVELSAAHRIDFFTAATAHDVVWKHFRAPYDVTVFELDGSARGAFMSAYLPHYSDVAWLRTLAHAGRATQHSARMLIAPHQSAAMALRDQFPDMRVAVAPVGVAAARACGDVVTAMRWPAGDEPDVAALSGMAAGQPVITFEMESTADWPALDPQTWRPRGRFDGPPIAVTIDPRDETHSRNLAITRLSRDAALRKELGTAAQAWWRSNATIERAVAAWTAILTEAAALPRPARGPAADGSRSARGILAEIGASVDFL